MGLGRGENIGHVHIFYHIRTLNTIPSASPNPEARIGSGDQLRFACGPDLPCFTVCCSDLDLLLTPPDLLRLQHLLGLSSEQFLAGYTERQLRGRAGLPLLFLRMREDEKKSCPFLIPQGCSIYSDRPLACRLYPLGLPPPTPVNVNVPVNVFESKGVMAARCHGVKVSKTKLGVNADFEDCSERLKEEHADKVEFSPVNVNVSVNVSDIDFRQLAFAETFLLIREPHCQGHASSRLWTVREWLADQCPGEELEQGRQFMESLLIGMRREA